MNFCIRVMSFCLIFICEFFLGLYEMMTMFWNLVKHAINIFFPFRQIFEGSNHVNVSHMIHDLSFGPKYPGIHNPLDGTVRILRDASGTFKYYIKVCGCLWYVRLLMQLRRLFLRNVCLSSSCVLCLTHLLVSYYNNEMGSEGYMDILAYFKLHDDPRDLSFIVCLGCFCLHISCCPIIHAASWFMKLYHLQ